MTLYNEWEELAKNLDDVYIFGTGAVGLKLFELLKSSNRLSNFKGFIVSKKDDRNTIFEYPIFELYTINNPNASVLVSVSVTYHPEIFSQLEISKFKKIIHAHKYYNLDLRSVRVENNISELIDHAKDDRLTEEQIKSREEIIARFQMHEHAFGKYCFYQSLPMLGILGTRKTDIRIKEYGLANFINKNSSVLDIGCNSGFLDIEISAFARNVLGLEYNDKLVDIGKMSISACGIKNVVLINADYNEWQKTNKNTFDIIMSFAVHVWLDVAPIKYTEQLYKMLNNNGYVIFESQTLSTDAKYSEYVKAFKSLGFLDVKYGRIIDDGETEREFVVLKKQTA